MLKYWTNYLAAFAGNVLTCGIMESTDGRIWPGLLLMTFGGLLFVASLVYATPLDK